MSRQKVAFVGPLERVLSLRAVPMLVGLAADELTAIAQHARERSFVRGSKLIDAGDLTSAAYVVIEGRVTVRRGKSIEVVNNNESVGFLDLLARSSTGLEATAETDTQTLELDWDEQLDLCEQYFSILLKYVRYLCERGINHFPHPATDASQDSGHDFSGLHRQLNIVERALAFGSTPVFSSCSPDALWELVRHVEELSFGSGEVIWETDGPADSFFLIVNGNIQCTDTSGETYDVQSGSTIGMFEAMSTQQRWYDATTTTPVTILSVDSNSFTDILEDHFDMAIEYMAAMARRILRGSHGSQAETSPTRIP